MPPKLDIEQVKALFTASSLITSWQVLTADDANPYSYIDLLVVFPQAPDKRQTAIEIRRALAD